jgi:translation initiation factor 1
MKGKVRKGTVYSTEAGSTCPACGRAKTDCACTPAESRPQGDGIVRVRRETKGRKGKCVTVIEGVLLDNAGLRELGKELKGACGSGGTVKEGRIEIQGDHRGRICQELQRRGWRVKQAGG